VGNNNPNLFTLEAVVAALGQLTERVVFVGGCAVALLLTEERADPIRPTEDVDLVVQAVTTLEYHQFERDLRKRGFSNDLRKGAPICRWVCKGIVVDVMPTHNVVLGFSNLWYPFAFQTSQTFALPSGAVIRLITAPSFIATKLEAFADRGKDSTGALDFMGSHDLEDIISVIDRRPELLNECKEEPEALRRYLSQNFERLLANIDFRSTLAGHLLGDSASQSRLGMLEAKLGAFVQLI
jgi:predicted nucleotidyltransferase